MSSRQRLWFINALAWSALTVGAVLLRWVDAMTTGRALSSAGVAMDVALLTMWALATPFILDSARRFPLNDGNARTNFAVHGVLATTFFASTNIVIRIPVLGPDVHAVMSSMLRAIPVFYPGALAAYGVIVALGHRAPAPLVTVPTLDDPPATDPSRLVIREWNRVHFIVLEDIDWIEADNNHVVVHTASRTYKGRERISDVESRLDARRFVRVHRSAIVHVPRIREVQPLRSGDQAIVMRSGTVVRVARARRQALEEALGTPL